MRAKGRSSQPRKYGQPLRAQPLRIVERGEVAKARVAQDRGHALAGPQLLAECNRARDVDAAGKAETKAFLVLMAVAAQT